MSGAAGRSACTARSMGQVAARRFAAEGATVVGGDIDAAAADSGGRLRAGTHDVDPEIRRFAGHGYPVAFEDRVPSGARIVYVDATAELPGMIEIIEMNEGQEAMYARFRAAAAAWDGADPVREG